MHNTREIVNGVYWIGASDRLVNRFENMFPLIEGMCYNAYFIDDEKTVVLDTVDVSVGNVFLENVEYLLKGRTLDYLVINHMEPDHCSNILNIVLRYPNVKLVGNQKTFQFLEQFYEGVPKENYLIVKEGDTLSLGKRQLRFLMAPLVHWPEVMFTYEETQKLLFTADAFGAFGSLNGNIFSDELDYELHTFKELRRYYANIVGKYAVNVQSILKKIKALSVDMILSLHGPIYRETKAIERVMSAYQQWSTYTPERKGVVIAYASMYGNTQEVASCLATYLAQRGVKNIQMFDVSHVHPSYVISAVFEYSHLVISAINYNATLYYPMAAFLEELCGLNIQNRKVSYIANTTWGGTALKQAQEMVAKQKNMETVGEVFQITSSMKQTQVSQLEQLADAIVASLKEESC